MKYVCMYICVCIYIPLFIKRSMQGANIFRDEAFSFSVMPRFSSVQFILGVVTGCMLTIQTCLSSSAGTVTRYK